MSPPAKQRRTGANKAVARMKYYRCAAAVLEAAGVPAAASTGSAGSLAAAELVQRRRLLRVTQRRMVEFGAGENRPHTTHQWHQYHLREAGVPLPPVVWKGVEGKLNGERTDTEERRDEGDGREGARGGGGEGERWD